MLFHDRSHAGQLLAQRLAHLAGSPDILVLALPRGGVPVAYEIARALPAALDVWVVRKLGAPQQPELAVGALAPGGVEILDTSLIARLGIPSEEVQRIVARERLELDRRIAAYRTNLPPQDPRCKTVLLVDDGLATGASMSAAVAALRPLAPTRILVAVPVADSGACQRLAAEAGEVICLYTPSRLESVGQWYENFSQTTDDEVCGLLTRSDP